MILKLFSWAWRFGKELFITLQQAHLSYLAASIAYFMVMSLIPFLLLLVSISGFMAHGSGNQFQDYIIQLIGSNSEVLKDSIEKYINFAINNKQILGIIAVLLLIWTSKGVVFSLNFGLDRVMMANVKKHYLRRWADTIIMLVIIIMLFSFSMCVMLLRSYSRILPISDVMSVSLWRTISSYIPYLATFIISFIAFYAIYRIIPTEKTKPRLALAGTIVGAVVWQVINGTFSWYLTKQTIYYQVIYGSIAALIYVILWVYLLALSILLGGAVIKAIKEVNLDNKEIER